MGEQEGKQLPLFETKEARFRLVYKVFASIIFAAICWIWVYRLTNIPGAGEQGRWAWIALSMSELAFGLYWILNQSVRWRIVNHYPFTERLTHRYDDDKLPAVDIFVCTADPLLEPPSMVINTVLSAMSYNYPPEKLSVYLSDDGGSEITFYALLKATDFSKHWLPFCRRFKIEPRLPEACFAGHHSDDKEWLSIKKLYEEMKSQIETVEKMGKVSEDLRKQHKGFSEWNSKTTKQDHQSIVEIIIDGRDRNAVADDGFQLPTLVYMAREKHPNHPHHFKAGAMNALIRVSSEISNAPFILNLDCDMYSNNADAMKEALCFFMDETKGHEISYVQFPQKYDNITKNDIYGSSFNVSNKIGLAGICGYGAALYCGTGCFHRRESITGMHWKDYNEKPNNYSKREDKRSVQELIDASKVLVDCNYEQGTLWGKEMGLVYGVSVEDICTGLVISCRGWKSIHYYPERNAFLGVAPTKLDTVLVQHKRWSGGMFQIFFSKYCPFIYGFRKIKLGMQMGYSIYLLWAPLSLPTICYIIVPPICLLSGIPLFPQLTSLWSIPFAYAFLANTAYSLFESLTCGDTFKGWWNFQKITLIRRTTAHFFGFIDVMRKQLGLSETKFDITDKTVSEDTLKRYEEEVFDFGSSSTMFTMIATFALLNLFGFIGGLKRVIMDLDFKSSSQLILQIVVCAVIVMVNKPVYEALFFRNDNGRFPSSVVLKSILVASLACCFATLF
ncbi:hypothetical protein L6164_030988 [Bauhinia variegata]|uniref:Uncharacterized protein n=1 Tax=Bauhinia variegata TaxID=167791 RepID=A0ACB9LEK3_BAUVA|nr:hypothetical protein L6164_030988 [Bauhinia variegata]